MEYVGGKTLKAVLRERRRAGQGPLPLDLAIAYVLAILPAFSYLHELRLVYNDFKPDNVMLQGGDVRLIDLGAVTRLEDPDPIIYGTEGYQAPEVATVGPSVPADLYSIARCLAVLVLEMPGYQTTHRHRLPSREQEPLFQRHESFYRFLLKATAQRLEDRYQTADEMEEALETILHEVTAVTRGTARPTISQIFGGDLQALHAGANGSALQPDWRHLPPVRVDPADPAAGFVLNAMVLDPPLQVAALREAIAQGTIETTAEAELGLARALIEVGQHAEAEMCLARVEQANRRDWRGSWYRGLSLLAQGRAHEAAMAFDLVYAELPGELAPKLGLALAAELMGDMGTADRLYDLVAATDHSFTSASFGLARARLAQGDRAGAAAAYQRIPPTSSLHTQAQVALARTLIGGPGQPAPVLDELAHASAVIERLPLTYGQRVELAAELLEAALALLESGAQAEAGGVLLLDHPFLENPVREALERAYRDLARLAVGPDKIRLVDRANQIRPLTAV
jgi:serine/threonine-protein kinase PknG